MRAPGEGRPTLGPILVDWLVSIDPYCVTARTQQAASTSSQLGHVWGMTRVGIHSTAVEVVSPLARRPYDLGHDRRRSCTLGSWHPLLLPDCYLVRASI